MAETLSSVINSLATEADATPSTFAAMNFALEEPSTTITPDYLEINTRNRSITIPESEKIFGTESDKKSEDKYFKINRYLDNNLDVSTLAITIAYVNAKGETGINIAENVVVEGDYVTFKWLLTPAVTAYQGNIKFIVSMNKTSEDATILNEWNTTLAYGTVLEGIAVGEPVVEPAEKDIITQLIQMVRTESTKAVAAVTAEGDKQVARVQAAGGGTTDYTALTNKPKINGVELTGDLTPEQLHIVADTNLYKLTEVV